LAPALVLVLASCLWSGGCASGPPKEETAVSAAVTRPELSAHVHYLAHPSLEGREANTAGGRKAVRYVTERFKACGLQPWPGTTGLQMPFGRGANVVGVLPGSDPELGKEMVLVIAHLDHLGRVGGKLYPGATDNASGAAALIELAEHFAGTEPRPARTICFLASDAEEKGLLGALAFACERLTDPSRLAAVVNMDCLGRKCFEGMPDTMLVFGTEAYPDLRAVTRRAAQSQRLRALPIGTDLLGTRADQVVFTPLGVPCLLFTCGTYRDYHGPDDTSNKIDYGKMLREVGVVGRVVRHLADSVQRTPRVEPERGDVEELAALRQILRVVRRYAWLIGMPARQRHGMDRLIAKADRLLARPEQYTPLDRRKYHEALAAALPEVVSPAKCSIESLAALYMHAMRHVLKYDPAGKGHVPPLAAYAWDIERPAAPVRVGPDGRVNIDTPLIKTTIKVAADMKGLWAWAYELPLQLEGTRLEVVDEVLDEWDRERDDVRGGACWDWLLEQVCGENAADDYEGWAAWRYRAEPGRAAGAPVAVLPMKSDDRLIVVSASVNGSPPLRFLVDSGSTHSMLGTAAAGRGGISAGMSRDAGVAGGKSVPVTTLLGAALSFDGTRVRLPLRWAVAAPAGVMDSLGSAAGYRIDGLLGYDLFRRYVVEVDYRARTMTLYEPRSYHYGGSGEALPITVERGWSLVDAAVTPAAGESPVPCRLLIDTGSDDVRLGGRVLEAHPALAAVATAESRSISIGGRSVERAGRLDAVRLGGFTVRGPLVSLSSTAGAPSVRRDGAVGAAVLDRFKVTFDYHRNRMILEPARPLDAPEPGDASGLALLAEGPDLRVYRVGWVYSPSTAKASGIKVGDVLTALDGRPASELTLNQVREALRQVGRRMRVGVRRGDTDLEYQVELRRATIDGANRSIGQADEQDSPAAARCDAPTLPGSS
jgi:hypothetical protein